MSRCRSRCLLPTPDELLLAPEVAALHTLLCAIEVTLVAVTAAQPDLWPTADNYDASWTDEVAAADEVIHSAQSLARAIDAYRALVLRSRLDP